eukprot:TRINITY_DN19771_c0_g1_i2.p1 TRINITY_DN19771_c0_g1~~TRINITY_DN19771_c0_g1_i2.p1  ORF type:complete len:585 (-),score=57.58 TRINITY_DN19771_c0_g1_i2:82-1836(-)
MAGAELHRCVPAEKWCVTVADLRQFRAAVCASLKTESLLPTELDQFHVDDWSFGPSIYTINEQLIKPITARAGNMSWALMLHPNGLRCDLFITHAWREGIFEFIRKVLSSWPSRARHAWCCMLANPQNLDIADMISTPLTSPFAKALMSAQRVLVVPNRHTSVYTRLWCCYEAYLAHREGKLIETACDSACFEICKALAGQFIIICSCLATAWLISRFSKQGCDRGISFCGDPGIVASFTFQFCYYLAVVCTLLSALISGDSARRFINVIGCASVSLTAPFPFPFRSSVIQILAFSRVNPYVSPGSYMLLFRTGWLVYFCVSEADRVKCNAANAQAGQLRKDYRGSVQYATCSDQRDTANIHNEIHENLEEVNEAIDVLIRAGMSSERLRVAAHAGVNVKHATYSDAAGAVAILNMGPYVAEFLLEDNIDWDDVMAYTTIMLEICVLSLLLAGYRDRRAFSLKVINKLFLWGAANVVLLGICISFGVIEGMTAAMTFAYWYAAGLLVAVLLCAAGIQRIAVIPIFGRCLARCLVARGCGHCRRWLRCQDPASPVLASYEDEPESEDDSEHDTDGSEMRSSFSSY